jgi:hypothetical protein
MTAGLPWVRIGAYLYLLLFLCMECFCTFSLPIGTVINQNQIFGAKCRLIFALYIRGTTNVDPGRAAAATAHTDVGQYGKPLIKISGLPFTEAAAVGGGRAGRPKTGWSPFFRGILLAEHVLRYMALIMFCL